MKKNIPMSENARALHEKETDENLDKMAKKLSKYWNKPPKIDKIPDLSFSKFEEKRNKSGQ